MPQKIKKIIRLYPWLLKSTLLLVVIIIITFISPRVIAIYKTLKKSGFSMGSLNTITQDPKDILLSTGNRTNFLLLGVRGDTQSDSPDLTDTILIASYNYLDNSITLISVPRDLYINSLKTKINAVYHYGRQQDGENGGFSLMNSAIQETLGLPVHYTVVVDFNLFKDVINTLGGLEIDVKTGFTDSKFPIPGKENTFPIKDRYQTIEFKQGEQTMNGETALKFVRSRNAKGDEGTDFARSNRQQLVLESLRNKILSSSLSASPETLSSLINNFSQNITTNIDKKIFPILVKLFLSSRSKPIKQINLGTNTDNDALPILYNPPPNKYSGQWVLVARDNNWTALHQYIQNKLSGTQ